MTITELNAKRDKLIAQLGVAGLTRENYSISFSTGDARLKELAVIDGEIAALSSSTAPSMARFTSHSRG